MTSLLVFVHDGRYFCLFTTSLVYVHHVFDIHYCSWRHWYTWLFMTSSIYLIVHDVIDILDCSWRHWNTWLFMKSLISGNNCWHVIVSDCFLDDVYKYKLIKLGCNWNQLLQSQGVYYIILTAGLLGSIHLRASTHCYQHGVRWRQRRSGALPGTTVGRTLVLPSHIHRLAGGLLHLLAVHFVTSVRGLHRAGQGRHRRPPEARSVPVHVRREHGRDEAAWLVAPVFVVFLKWSFHTFRSVSTTAWPSVAFKRPNAKRKSRNWWCYCSQKLE